MTLGCVIMTFLGHGQMVKCNLMYEGVRRSFLSLINSCNISLWNNRNHPLSDTDLILHDMRSCNFRRYIPSILRRSKRCLVLSGAGLPYSSATQKLICFIAISPGHYNIIISGD